MPCVIRYMLDAHTNSNLKFKKLECLVLIILHILLIPRTFTQTHNYIIVYLGKNQINFLKNNTY